MQRLQLIASTKLQMRNIKDCSQIQQIEGGVFSKFTFAKICENRRQWENKKDLVLIRKDSSIIDLLEGVMETEKQDSKMNPWICNDSPQKMLTRKSGVMSQFFFLKDHPFKRWQQILLCFRESLRHFAETRDYFQKITEDMFLVCSEGNLCVNRRPQSVCELKQNGKNIYSQSESLLAVTRLFEKLSLKHFPTNSLFQDIQLCSNFKLAVNFIDQFTQLNRLILPSHIRMPAKIKVSKISQTAPLHFSGKKLRRQPRNFLNQTSSDLTNYRRNTYSSKTVGSTLNQSNRSSPNSSMGSVKDADRNKIRLGEDWSKFGSSSDLNMIVDSIPQESEIKASDELILSEPPSCLEELNDKMCQSINIKNEETPVVQFSGYTSLLDTKLRGNIAKSIMDFDELF